MNRKPPKHSPEMRERAVRMVSEHLSEHPSQWAAIESIASKIGRAPQTRRTWIRQQDVDDGRRPGMIDPVPGFRTVR
jgi:transposase